MNFGIGAPEYTLDGSRFHRLAHPLSVQITFAIQIIWRWDSSLRDRLGSPAFKLLVSCRSHLLVLFRCSADNTSHVGGPSE